MNTRIARNAAAGPAGTLSNHQLQWSVVHAFVATIAFAILVMFAGLIFQWNDTQALFMLVGLVWLLLFMIGFTFPAIRSVGTVKRSFELNLFTFAFLARCLAVAITLIAFESYGGSPFEPHSVDSANYHEMGLRFAEQVRSGHITLDAVVPRGNVSNAGYILFVGSVYVLSGDSILVLRIVQALIGALTALLLYRAISTAVSPAVGRTAGILAAAYPYLVYYAGLHLKETLLIAIIVLIFYLTVQISMGRQRHMGQIAVLIAAIGTLFLFRTFVGILMIGSVGGHFLLQGRRQGRSVAKPIFAAAVIVVAGLAIVASQARIRGEVVQMWAMSRGQLERELADKENKLDSELDRSVVTVPLFMGAAAIGPLPSMTGFAGQENSSIQYSFAWIRLSFTIFALAGMFAMLRRGGSAVSVMLFYLGGYLFVLSLAGLSTSHRFQLPTLPVWIAMTAVGLHVAWKRKVVLGVWAISLVVMSGVALYWNYFKLAVRGL